MLIDLAGITSFDVVDARIVRTFMTSNEGIHRVDWPGGEPPFQALGLGYVRVRSGRRLPLLPGLKPRPRRLMAEALMCRCAE